MSKQKSDTRYMCLHRSIWNDDKFPFVSDACQLIFIHVMSNPFGLLGVYKASVEALAAEKRRDIKDYRKGFEEGIREGFFEYDEKHHVIYIPNFQRYNPPQNPNVVKNFGRHFNEVPRCPLKQKFYDSFKEQMEDFGEAFLKAFHESFDEPFPEGLCEGLPKGPVTVTVTDTVPSSSSGSKTETIDKSTAPMLRRFSDNPQNLVDLWNQVAEQYRLPTVRKLTDELKAAIKKAYKDLPDRKDWEELFAEIPLSSTLQGKIGDGNWAPSLGWMLKKNKGESEPNYSKALNGAWRDKNGGGMSGKTRAAVDAVQTFLSRNGIYDGEFRDDGHGSIQQSLQEMRDSSRVNSESGDDENLLPGPLGLPAGESLGGDDLGEEEFTTYAYEPGPEDIHP